MMSLPVWLPGTMFLLGKGICPGFSVSSLSRGLCLGYLSRGLCSEVSVQVGLCLSGVSLSRVVSVGKPPESEKMGGTGILSSYVENSVRIIRLVFFPLAFRYQRAQSYLE